MLKKGLDIIYGNVIANKKIILIKIKDIYFAIVKDKLTALNINNKKVVRANSNKELPYIYKK